MTQQIIHGFAPRDTRPKEQIVIFAIGEYSFVISASAVQEIRSTDSLGGNIVELERPVLRKVRHVVERDSHSYYVVSGYEHFRLPLSRPTSVLILRNVPAAVLVDRIEEMAEMRVLLGLPRTFCGEERTWYRGLTVVARKVVPVAEPRGFLTSEELRQLEAANPGLLQRVANSAKTLRQQRERV